MADLIGMFRVSFEAPDTASEIARYRAWVPPNDDDAPLGLARAILNYPGTSDARRSLLDLSGLYARKGEWSKAEAPFLYVMEVAKGRSEARVAHFRMIEMYIHAGTPPGKDLLNECRSAVERYAGTPEEGLGRLLLADILAERKAYDEAVSEYGRVMMDFPDQPYSSYSRTRFALALVAAGKPAQAREVLIPVLADPVWGGRAHLAYAKAYLAESQVDKAVASFEKAAQLADNLSLRGEAHLSLAGIAKGRGQLAYEREHLMAYLQIAPRGPERSPARLDLARNWYASGQYVEAAQAACDLEMDVLNAPKRHSPDQLERLRRGCEELLDACERALSTGAPSPPR